MTTSCWRLPRLLDARAGHRDRVAERPRALTRVERRVVAADVAPLRREHRHAGPLADDLQLGDRVGPLQVGGDEQRGVPLVLEPAGQLAGQRGLARPLQAGQHDHGRRVLGERDPAGLAAEDADELVVDDLDDLLGRVQGAG